MPWITTPSQRKTGVNPLPTQLVSAVAGLFHFADALVNDLLDALSQDRRAAANFESCNLPRVCSINLANLSAAPSTAKSRVAASSVTATHRREGSSLLLRTQAAARMS